MKGLLLAFMCFASVTQAQSVYEYQCDNKAAKTSEDLISLMCYHPIVSKALATVQPLSYGHDISACYTTTAPATGDKSKMAKRAEETMKQRYGRYDVEFVDFYVNTNHNPRASGTDKFNPKIGAFVVRVKAVMMKSIDGARFCHPIDEKAEIVFQK